MSIVQGNRTPRTQWTADPQYIEAEIVFETFLNYLVGEVEIDEGYKGCYLIESDRAVIGFVEASQWKHGIGRLCLKDTTKLKVLYLYNMVDGHNVAKAVGDKAFAGTRGLGIYLYKHQYDNPGKIYEFITRYSQQVATRRAG